MENLLEDIPDRVGVFVSGGADSSLLLYMLCQAGHTCVPLTIDRTTRHHQLPYARTVVDWIQQYYPDQLEDHHIQTVSDDNIVAERRAICDALELEYDIDTWVNGMTKNPPVKLAFDSERDTKRDKDLVWKNGKHLRPFYQLDKRDIVQLYNDMCITELLDISFSCETSDPACGVCWWCEERTWALNEFSANIS